MLNADYTYTNKSDAFNVVKFDLGGNFVIVGDDVSDEVLIKMENMETVNGWEIE